MSDQSADAPSTLLTWTLARRFSNEEWTAIEQHAVNAATCHRQFGTVFLNPTDSGRIRLAGPIGGQAEAFVLRREPFYTTGPDTDDCDTRGLAFGEAARSVLEFAHRLAPDALTVPQALLNSLPALVPAPEADTRPLGQMAARRALAAYSPADPATWANASAVVRLQDEARHLFGATLEQMRPGTRPEHRREYEDAQAWLRENSRFDPDSHTNWLLPNVVVIRASALQERIEGLEPGDPRTWTVPAEHALLHRDFLRMDLKTPAAYPPETLRRLDALQADLSVPREEVLGEAAGARLAVVQEAQAVRDTLWRSAIEHHAEMMWELTEITQRAQRAFLDRQRAMSAIVSDVDCELRAGALLRGHAKLSGFRAEAQEAYAHFERAAEALIGGGLQTARDPEESLAQEEEQEEACAMGL